MTFYNFVLTYAPKNADVVETKKKVLQEQLSSFREKLNCFLEQYLFHIQMDKNLIKHRNRDRRDGSVGKTLISKYKDLSLEPHHPCKTPDIAVCDCSLDMGGRQFLRSLAN